MVVNMYKKLVIMTALLALCVVVLGAYVRLSDAGLGCPDWPGCYGSISPHHAANDISQAEAAQPNGPVTVHKAWKEMVHRYFAGTLGLLIAIIGIWAWSRRKVTGESPLLPTLLIGLVVFQALLGMWTVTERLMPVVVSSHLLGGMTTLGLLIWLAGTQISFMSTSIDKMAYRSMRVWALIGLVLVMVQIALGGWVSTNYAALACTGFPQCSGVWWPEMNFNLPFHLIRGLGMTAAGDLLPRDGLVAIHWVHRLGAYVVFLYVGWMASKMLRFQHIRNIAMAVLIILSLQVGLGISNVLFGLPLAVAVAHNGVAAMLLSAMVLLNLRLNSK